MEDNNGIAIDPWELARDRYLEDLSEDEDALFENATIENIFYGASAAQKLHEADSKTRLAARKLKPLVAALEQYGKALDVYSNASPTIMCPLWGSIRVVLQVEPPSLLIVIHPVSAIVEMSTDSVHIGYSLLVPSINISLNWLTCCRGSGMSFHDSKRTDNYFQTIRAFCKYCRSHI